MVKRRKRIGLIFGLDNNWIGGSYYLMNVVKALNTLDDLQKPHIVFLSDMSQEKTIKDLKYPYYSIKNPYKIKRSLIEAIINRLIKILTTKDAIDKRISDKDVDVLFPASFDNRFNKIRNKIFWIPDFQHHFYPEFFTKDEIENRSELYKKIASTHDVLVLSSYSAKEDFISFYPKHQVRTKVIPFAVTHEDFSQLHFKDLKRTYAINKPYFIVTNQFWQHKNHMLVLKAISYLKRSKSQLNFQVVFTGKPDDYRAPKFYKSLTNFIQNEQLSSDICFVGFIPRNHQLKLMEQSIAVIQPSLFEGWSTVVEDAKALNKSILLSNIPVHREQKPKYGVYFDVDNEVELAKLLVNFKSKTHDKNTNFTYEGNVKAFGEKLNQLFNV